MSTPNLLPPTSPIIRGVRMFAAPVLRGGSVEPVPFDPAAQGRFDLEAPPAGWFSVGNVLDLLREDGSTYAEILSGAPAQAKTRGRNKSAAAVRLTFTAWSKLALLLSGGSQQMNLLREPPGTSTGAGVSGSGGPAAAAVPVLAGSTGSVLLLPGSAAVQPGDLMVVDDDYTGATGYVGAGVPGAYVRSAAAIGAGLDYVRRVSFNVSGVAQVTTLADGTLQATLTAPLPAGVPTASMKMATLQGFADRVGGSFLQEWSALFVLDGLAGDRVLLHYPRLQPAAGPGEVKAALAPGLERWRLQAHLTALPVTDTNDGEAVLCFRSYLPAPMRTP